MSAPEQQLDDLTSSTVMVVDDEPTIIDVMKSFLEGEGYRNLVATSDSRRAVELLQASAATFHYIYQRII